MNRLLRLVSDIKIVKIMNNSKFKIRPEWYSADLVKNKDWEITLSPEEKFYITKELDNLISNDLSPCSSLSELNSLFDKINNSVINEYGFLIVKKFPTPDSTYSTDIIRKFYLEFCRNLGVPLIQNKNHDYVFDVKSIKSVGDLNVRGPHISGALPLHPDHGGLLGMYCLNSSDHGGHTLLASTYTVHYEIEKFRPDLLKILYQPFYGDRRGQEQDGALPYDINPIFAIKEDKLLCQYVGFYYFDAMKKFANIPKLTQLQCEAIELFEQVCNRKDIQFEIKLQPGDIIFINNNRVLHGRTEFHNQNNERHLLRIWLSTPKIKSFPHYYGYSMPN